MYRIIKKCGRRWKYRKVSVRTFHDHRWMLSSVILAIKLSICDSCVVGETVLERLDTADHRALVIFSKFCLFTELLAF